MRPINVNYIKEGSILGKSIYSSNSQLLLSKGIKLDRKLISTLKRHQILYVYIDDELSEGIEVKNVVDDAVRVEAVTTMKKLFTKGLYHSKGREKTEWIPLQARQEVENIIDKIMSNLKENQNILYSMTELMGTDMYTYQHSVNVAILSILTSRTLGLKEDKIKAIAMGGLLHDIGKAKISPEILNKSEGLSKDEEEIFKKHPEYGYESICNDPSLSNITKQIIYMHHELKDGSGYPRGIKNDEIPMHSMIVTICDIFDSLTSDKLDKTKLPVYKAMEILSSKAFSEIDPYIYSGFIENIAVYPVGTGVVLEDGRVGIVVDIHRSFPTRPIVKIIKDEQCAEHYEIDLTKKLTVFIKETIELEEVGIK